MSGVPNNKKNSRNLKSLIEHTESDNKEHIIQFASQGLSDVENIYFQTENESLELVKVVERFYYYLTGLEFELFTGLLKLF